MGGNFLAGFLGATLLAAASSPAAAKCSLNEVGQIPVSMEGLDPLIDASINGHQTRLVADSGAFFSLLTTDDAEKFDLKPDPGRSIWIEGVNGAVRGGIRTAQDFVAARSRFKDVDFVTAYESFGRGISGLLGENFLNVTDTEYDLANGVIRFFHADDCQNDSLAYWSAGQPYSMIPIHKSAPENRRILGHVIVDGVELAAQFDTGTGYSVVSVRGAAKLGIRKNDPRLKPGGVSGGLGRRLNQTWIVSVDSFRIGDEEIKNTGLRVSELDLDDVDMLIGADFFLSHRVFVANSQQKLYLTYNGGPVFKLDVINKETDAADGAGAKPAASPPTTSAGRAEEPTDAGDFARRARARAARGDLARAFTDFDRAVALAPTDPQIVYARAQAYADAKRYKLALADFDSALRLKPNDTDMLLSRAAVHLKDKQPDLAKADFDQASRWDRDLMLTIAASYSSEKYYPEALAEYDAYLARGAPKRDEKTRVLGYKCFVRAVWNHDLDRALSDCKQALWSEPGANWLLFDQAFVFLRLGRFEDAVRNLNDVVRSAPKDAFSLYCRGLAKIGAGKPEQGQTDIKTALAIDPEVAARAKGYDLSPPPAAAPKS